MPASSLCFLLCPFAPAFQVLTTLWCSSPQLEDPSAPSSPQKSVDVVPFLLVPPIQWVTKPCHAPWSLLVPVPRSGPCNPSLSQSHVTSSLVIGLRSLQRPPRWSRTISLQPLCYSWNTLPTTNTQQCFLSTVSGPHCLGDQVRSRCELGQDRQVVPA